MSARKASRPTPESERNPPKDRTPGWKPFSPGIERWWMGRQWGESFQAARDDDPDTAA